MRHNLVIAWLLLGLVGCAAQDAPPPPRPEYALVIHGGAGSTPAQASQEQLQAARDSLERALREGLGILEAEIGRAHV